MTQLQPLDFSNTSGHAMDFFTSPAASTREYDPTDDGPEVETINRILATHKLYVPGKESSVLRFQRFVDKVARLMYDDRYGRLGKKRQQNVRRQVISLHVEGLRPGAEHLIVLEP